MKLHKIFLFAAVAFATVFTSCSDDNSYTPGKPAGSYNIGFTSEESVVVGLNDTKLTVYLTRENKSGKITVPVKVLSNEAGFSVPSTVEFADGDSIAAINIGVPADMKMATDYTLSICIPEEYTNPYKTGAYSPICKFSVVKEDYEVKYTGTHVDQFWNADDNGAYESPVNVEYSPTFGLYRVKDLFLTGNSDMFFKWNDDNTITITNGEGKAVKYQSTGYVYSASYGCYVGFIDADQKFYYDPDTKIIYLPFDWGLENFGPYWGVYANTIVLN